MQEHWNNGQLWAHLFEFFLSQAMFELLLAMDVAAVSGNWNSVEISEFCKDLLLSEELLLGYCSVFQGTVRHSSLATAYLFWVSVCGEDVVPAF